MTITNLTPEWVAVLDAIGKATIILAVTALATFAMRRTSAALRHLVWTLALCSALALPVLSMALPKWQLPLVTIAAGEPLVVESPAEDAPASAPVVSRRSGTSPAPPSAPPADVQSANDSPLVRMASSITWQQGLLAIWAVGVLAVLARLGVGILAVQWLSRRTQAITDAAWLPMADALAADLGVRGPLQFRRSHRDSMPVAAGIFRPSIIMPADAESWSESRLRIVLLHELAHVKRRDCLTHLLAQAVCAFYWFNPLAWLAAKRARAERERACDDLVLACGTRGSDYADELLEMARTMHGNRLSGLLTGASLAMAHKSQLEGRLIAILDPRLPRAGVSRRRAVAAAIVFCGAVAPLGALQLWSSHGVNAVNELNDLTAGNTAAAPPRPDWAPAARSRASAAVVPAPVPQPEPQPAPAPQVPQVAQPLPPAPIVPEVMGPVTRAAIETVSVNETAVAEAVEEALQDQKSVAAKPADGTKRQADPRMVAALTAALKDSDKEVRETAMHALVRLRDPAVYEPLVQALKDASPEIREQAIHGLGQLRDRRAVEPLAAALKDENASVREQAAFALGQLRDKSVVPALVAALKDSNADVREQAAFALGQLRDASAVDGLATAVRDENPDVREQAVFALSQIRDRRAVGPLVSALKDQQADVRQQAAFALGQLRDPGAVEALVVAIKDPNADVREQVAFALGQIRDPRAIDALTTALKDASAEVRQQAAFALGQLIR